MRKFIEGLPKSYFNYPMPVTVVGIQKGETRNLIPLVWHVQLSFDPPLYGVSISPKRFSHNLLLEAGEFSVNFLPFEMVPLIARLGSVSGREVDKIKEFNVQVEPARKIDGFILKDAYVSFECQLIEHTAFQGDHTFFVGLVVATHYETEFFDENTVIDVKAVKPTLYIGKYRYLTVDPESLKDTSK